MINIMGKKNLFLTLIAALLLFHFPAVAQKKPFTGKVTYKIDLNMAGLPEEVKGMMPKSMAMYIGESKVKTEIRSGQEGIICSKTLFFDYLCLVVSTCSATNNRNIEVKTPAYV
jgi:hypothetical protein